MRNNPILVMSHRRLRNRAYVAGAGLEHVWVVRWKNSRRGAYDGTQRIIHLLRLGLLDRVLKCGAGRRRAVARGDGRVRVEVVVVVGRCSYYRALHEEVSMRWTPQ